MSFLNTSHEVHTTTKLPAHITKGQVIALLHDHKRMITLNPLVTKYHRQPADVVEAFFKTEPAEYRASGTAAIPVYSVTDDYAAPGAEQEAKVGNWRGGWAERFVPESITYDAAFQNHEDGLLMITHAPMGVHCTTTWLVQDAEDESDGLVLEERAKVTSNRLLMGFIKTTLKGSHEKLVRDFVAALEREAAGTPTPAVESEA